MASPAEIGALGDGASGSKDALAEVVDLTVGSEAGPILQLELPRDANSARGRDVRSPLNSATEEPEHQQSPPIERVWRPSAGGRPHDCEEGDANPFTQRPWAGVRTGLIGLLPMESIFGASTHGRCRPFRNSSTDS